MPLNMRRYRVLCNTVISTSLFLSRTCGIILNTYISTLPTLYMKVMC